MDRQIIETCKEYIETDLLDELQLYVQSLFHLETPDYRLPWESIYQQVYLHACLKKKEVFAKWIQGLFTTIFDDIQQIGLRHMFAYGNYLLKNKSS